MEPKPVVSGDSRTFRVILDPNQYQRDIDNINKGAEVGINFTDDGY